MNFVEAVRAYYLSEFPLQHIKRKKWKAMRIKFDSGNGRLIFEYRLKGWNRHDWQPRSSDILAKDWMLVEELP